MWKTRVSTCAARAAASLAAAGKRLQTMLQAVETVRPALQDFYNSLGDEQRARFNIVGRQLSAAEQ
jgi:hypothetical protein